MTPEQLDKWSKKRAEEFADSFVNDDLQFKVIAAEHFSAGMAAAQEVHELVGRIKALNEAIVNFREDYGPTPRGFGEWVEMKRLHAEFKLEALLGAEEK